MLWSGGLKGPGPRSGKCELGLHLVLGCMGSRGLGRAGGWCGEDAGWCSRGPRAIRGSARPWTAAVRPYSRKSRVANVRTATSRPKAIPTAVMFRRVSFASAIRSAANASSFASCCAARASSLASMAAVQASSFAAYASILATMFRPAILRISCTAMYAPSLPMPTLGNRS